MPNLRQMNPPVAISVGGNLEPIEPVYTNINRQSALGTAYPIPASQAVDNRKAPFVVRAQDTRGMRYMYADMRQLQPLSKLGTGPNLGVAVWQSRFQPFLGSLRDYGFYDLLFRAGYPGFNLGLSFRVPVNPSVGGLGPGKNIRETTPNRRIVYNAFTRVMYPGQNNTSGR
jgi:hypothetical protein